MASNDSEIKIKVGFEPGEVPPEVFERINKLAAEVREQFAGTSAAIAGMNGEASATCEELKAIIDLAKREGNELLAGNIENAFGSMENAEWLADMAAKEEELRGKQDALVSSTEAMMKAFQDGTVPATQMLETLEKAKEEAEQYGETLQRLKDGPAAIEKGLDAVHDVSFGQIVTQIRELADTFVQADADMEEMRYSAGETGVAIRSFFDSVKKAGNKDLLGDMVDLFGGEKMVKGLLNAEKRVEGYGKMLEWAKERAQELAAAVDGGSLSAPEALGQVEALQRMMMRVSEFAQQMPQALQQLGGMDTLERNLESLNAIPEAFEQQRQAIAAVLEPLQENTQAWRDYQAGLDATAESYAAEFAYAQKVIAQNVAMEDALQKQSAALQSNAEKAKESAKIYDGTAMSYKDAQEAMQVHTAALEAAARTTEGLNERVHAAYAQRTADADRAAQAQAKAEAKAAEAAEAAAKEAEKEAYAMQLATMSATELAEEITQLTAAREEAAEANDAEAYEEISEKMGAAKQQLRAVKNELNISKMSMLQNAQAGMQFGAQLTSFSEKLESGEMSLSAFTSSVMGLGMALQGSLGPIGWVMVGVQMLSMVISRLAAAQEEERKREEKHRDSLRELRKAVRELREENKLLQMQKESDLQLKQTAFLFEKIAMATQERADTLNAVAKNQQAYNDAKAQDRTLETEADVVKIQTDILAGLKTRIDGEREIAKLKLAQNKADLQKEIDDAERKAKNARELAANARKRENDVQQTYQNAIQSRTEAGYTIDPRILKNTEKEMEAVWAYLDKNYGIKEENQMDAVLTGGNWRNLHDDAETAWKMLEDIKKQKKKLDELRNDPTLWSSLAEGKGGVAGYEIEYEKHKKQEEIAEQALAAARADADRAEKDSSAAAEVAAKVRQSNNKRLKQLDTLDKEHDKQTEIQKKNAKDDKAHGERMNRLRARLEDMTAAQVDAQLVIARGAAQEKGLTEQEKKRRKEIVTLYEQRRKQLRKELNNAADTRLGLVNGKVQQGVNKKETAKNRKASGQALAAWAQEAKASKGDLSDDADIARWYGDNKQLADTLIDSLDKKQAKKVRDAINGLVNNVKTAGIDGESELTRALQELTAAAERTPDVADDKTASVVLKYAAQNNRLITQILSRNENLETGMAKFSGELTALQLRVDKITKRN